MTMAHGLALATRLLLGAILIGAGVPKLAHWRRFASAVAGYSVVPGWAAPAIARVLPLAEVGIGALLVSGVTARIAAASAALLFAGFAAAMAVDLARGRAIDCGCSGSAPRQITTEHALADLVLAGLALFAAAQTPMKGWDATSPEPAEVAPVLLLLGTALVCYSLVRHFRRATRAAKP